MNKMKHKQLADQLLPEELLSAIMYLRDCLGPGYRFKVKESRSWQLENGGEACTIFMVSQGSRQAMLQRQIYTTLKSTIRQMWCRKLRVSVYRQYQAVTSLPVPRLHNIDVARFLHPGLRPAVRKLYEERSFRIIDIDRGVSGEANIHLILQHRDQARRDGERIMCTTIEIEYYDNGII